jgi:hypothetical protein
VENKQAVDLGRAVLALLNGTGGGLRNNNRKIALAKAKEANAKIPEPR